MTDTAIATPPAATVELRVSDRTAPMRLALAVEIAFPHGGMTVSGLRKEAAKGRLVIEHIAGKDFVTLAAIDDMRAACRNPVPKRSPSGPELRLSTSRVAVDSLLLNVKRHTEAATGQEMKAS